MADLGEQRVPGACARDTGFAADERELVGDDVAVTFVGGVWHTMKAYKYPDIRYPVGCLMGCASWGAPWMGRRSWGPVRYTMV